jgi:hypothetical protein
VIEKVLKPVKSLTAFAGTVSDAQKEVVMSTFRIGNPRRGSLRRVLGFAAAAVATLVTGCKNSNDVTGTTIPATPTPVPISIAGAWVGTFTPNFPFYYAEPASANANLQQTGSTVDGTINISGSPTETVHLTISGTIHVNGTIEDSGGAGTATGTIVGGTLSIYLMPHIGSNAGQLTLKRSG